jgi:hypothetical protein
MVQPRRRPGPGASRPRIPQGERGWIFLEDNKNALPHRPTKAESYSCPSITGNPFFPDPITTTLEFTLFANASVASIPFHSSSAGLIP